MRIIHPSTRLPSSVYVLGRVTFDFHALSDFYFHITFKMYFLVPPHSTVPLLCTLWVFYFRLFSIKVSCTNINIRRKVCHQIFMGNRSPEKENTVRNKNKAEHELFKVRIDEPTGQQRLKLFVPWISPMDKEEAQPNSVKFGDSLPNLFARKSV